MTRNYNTFNLCRYLLKVKLNASLITFRVRLNTSIIWSKTVILLHHFNFMITVLALVEPAGEVPFPSYRAVDSGT